MNAPRSASIFLAVLDRQKSGSPFHSASDALRQMGSTFVEARGDSDSFKARCSLFPRTFFESPLTCLAGGIFSNSTSCICKLRSTRVWFCTIISLSDNEDLRRIPSTCSVFITTYSSMINDVHRPLYEVNDDEF